MGDPKHIPSSNDMPAQTVRIATRKSPLAMWQAEHVAARLRAAGIEVCLLPFAREISPVTDWRCARALYRAARRGGGLGGHRERVFASVRSRATTVASRTTVSCPSAISMPSCVPEMSMPPPASTP